MPYLPIPTAQIQDAARREALDRANQLLADVYTMLGRHRLAQTKGGACNLAATLVLVSILHGLAETIYPGPEGASTQTARFKALVADKLPWNCDQRWTPINAAKELLWEEFRNPLAHKLGMDKRSNARKPLHVEPTAGVWGLIKPRRISYVDNLSAWPADWPVLSVLTDTQGTRDKLTVAALYWAVKQLLQILTR